MHHAPHFACECSLGNDPNPFYINFPGDGIFLSQCDFGNEVINNVNAFECFLDRERIQNIGLNP